MKEQLINNSNQYRMIRIKILNKIFFIKKLIIIIP